MSDVRLECGMLLLDTTSPGSPQLVTVTAAGRKPTVVAHFGRFSMEAKLKRDTLPDGWWVIDNKTTAAYLATEGVQFAKPAPFTESADDEPRP